MFWVPYWLTLKLFVPEFLTIPRNWLIRLVSLGIIPDIIPSAKSGKRRMSAARMKRRKKMRNRFVKSPFICCKLNKIPVFRSKSFLKAFFFQFKKSYKLEMFLRIKEKIPLESSSAFFKNGSSLSILLSSPMSILPTL